jgi:hypothetical protein
LTELEGLLWLAAGLGGLVAAAGLVACCLRIESPIEFVLATYVLAWSWLVAVALLLSPPELVTRGWLIAGIAVGLVGAIVTWVARGRPPPPSPSHAAASLKDALRRPAVAVLAIVVGLGAAYTFALGVLTPVVDGDAHAYHLARAAFWKQAQEIGYIANALEPRLNVNPPNAEIGQLATMLLSGSDRYVTLPQLAAYGALTLAVVGLGRRVGLSVPEAVFGGLVFATLPVVFVQASGALNDLVVASFVAAAAYFALRPGRSALLLFALALGLAIGTKFTAVLALPMLAVVIALARPRRRLPLLAGAAAVGLAFGSVWYLVNLRETGSPDGDLAESAEQRVPIAIAAIAWNGARLAFDLVDMPGSGRPYSSLFAVAGLVLALIGLAYTRRTGRPSWPFLLAALVTACIAALPSVSGLYERALFKTWLLVGEPEDKPVGNALRINDDADSTVSWFGPLGMLLLVAFPVAAVVLRRRHAVSTALLGMSLAPLLLLVTFSLTIVWDPWRGRFLIAGVALAAAAWGVLLRWPAAAGAVAAIGATALALSLANNLGKPSGLGDIWAPRVPGLSTSTIWGAPRWDAETRLRPGEGEAFLYRYLEKNVPPDARVALAVRGNDYIFPYFGPRVSREITLVRPHERVPPEAEWLVISPLTRPARCPESWRSEYPRPPSSMHLRVERRIGPDDCFSG